MFEKPNEKQEIRPERKPIKIESVRQIAKIKELCGLSCDSSHDTIIDTKAMIVQVKFSQPVRLGGYTGRAWELIILAAKIASEPTCDSSGELSAGPEYWRITDFKAIEISGKHGNFALVDLESSDNSDNEQAAELLYDLIDEDSGNIANT